MNAKISIHLVFGITYLGVTEDAITHSYDDVGDFIFGYESEGDKEIIVSFETLTKLDNEYRIKGSESFRTSPHGQR
jgi:hypothetical protein